MIHTSFYKGSKIRLILNNGDVVVAKFIEKLGHRKLRTSKGEFNIVDIRSANYYKPLKHERE